MDVFEAFPNAIVSNIWQIAECQRGSLVGTVFDGENSTALDVIVDEGGSTTIDSAPNTEPLDVDLLVYAKPAQLPTTNVRELVSDYMLYDGLNNDYYAIVDAAIGKNQETGVIEHVELLLKQTEVVE